jgi:hypothetical protein
MRRDLRLRVQPVPGEPSRAARHRHRARRRRNVSARAWHRETARTSRAPPRSAAPASAAHAGPALQACRPGSCWPRALRADGWSFPGATASQSASVSATATRVSSRTAHQPTSPASSARASSGKLSRAFVTRSFSWMVRDLYPNTRSIYSAKLPCPKWTCTAARKARTSQRPSSASAAARWRASRVRASCAWTHSHAAAHDRALSIVPMPAMLARRSRCLLAAPCGPRRPVEARRARLSLETKPHEARRVTTRPRSKGHRLSSPGNPKRGQAKTSVGRNRFTSDTSNARRAVVNRSRRPAAVTLAAPG